MNKIDDLPFSKEVLAFLEMAKGILHSEKELMAMAFIVGSDGAISVNGLCFSSEEEKRAIYAQLYAEWLPKNPQCIMLLNDVWQRDKAGLDSKRIGEMLSMIICPRGAHAWGLSVPYVRLTDCIEFSEPKINRNEDGKSLGGQLMPKPWAAAANIEFERMGVPVQ